MEEIQLMLIGLVKTRNTTHVGRFIFEKILSGCYAAKLTTTEMQERKIRKIRIIFDIEN